MHVFLIIQTQTTQTTRQKKSPSVEKTRHRRKWAHLRKPIQRREAEHPPEARPFVVVARSSDVVGWSVGRGLDCLVAVVFWYNDTSVCFLFSCDADISRNAKIAFAHCRCFFLWLRTCVGASKARHPESQTKTNPTAHDSWHLAQHLKPATDTRGSLHFSLHFSFSLWSLKGPWQDFHDTLAIASLACGWALPWQETTGAVVKNGKAFPIDKEQDICQEIGDNRWSHAFCNALPNRLSFLNHIIRWLNAELQIHFVHKDLRWAFKVSHL